MRKALILLAALLLPLAARAQPPAPVGGDMSNTTVKATGGSTARLQATRAADVFNIADYGAKCDGATNDDAAINATLAAAFASPSYSQNDQVVVTGPVGATKGCFMNSVNATIFNKGTGSNTRPQVVFRNLTLLCSGVGNICFDAIGADLIKMQNVSIRGDPNFPPEICIQVGTLDTTKSSAWHSFEHVNCNSNFAFTALFNVGSEANYDTDVMMVNNQSASGPIGTVGTITGGTGYANGTYTAVPLTGGSGTGGLATVVVAGTAVSSVTISYEGRDYAPGDVLSAAAASIGGSGSGFSVPVGTIATYAAVFDGQNHWRAHSAFQTVTATPEAWLSLTLDTCINCNFRQTASGGVIWLGWTGGLRLVQGYAYNNTGPTCVTLYDNGTTKGGIPGPNWGLNLDLNCEGAALTSQFVLTGSNGARTLQGFRYAGYHQAASMFAVAPNITSVTMNGADINLLFGAGSTGSGSNMFAAAKLWNMSGRVMMPSALIWNAPSTFQGSLVVGKQATPPGIGPLDIMGNASLALSCGRLLNAAYTGPLCRITNAAGTSSIDLYPDSTGAADRGAYAAFCGTSACSLNIAYDQSGNGNNCTQATVASQPALAFTAALGNRLAMGFGDQSALALPCGSTTANTDLFAAGGYISAVTNVTGSANQADRIAYKNNGSIGSSGIGWDWRMNFVGTSQDFGIAASTAGGQWNTPGFGTVPMVVDLQYNTASLANVPVVGFQGTPQTITVAAQPTGSIPTDAPQPLIVGNNAATAGIRGFPGGIEEIIMWKTTPTAQQIEAVRRNQAAFAGLGAVVN